MRRRPGWISLSSKPRHHVKVEIRRRGHDSLKSKESTEWYQPKLPLHTAVTIHWSVSTHKWLSSDQDLPSRIPSLEPSKYHFLHLMKQLPKNKLHIKLLPLSDIEENKKVYHPKPQKTKLLPGYIKQKQSLQGCQAQQDHQGQHNQALQSWAMS